MKRIYVDFNAVGHRGGRTCVWINMAFRRNKALSVEQFSEGEPVVLYQENIECDGILRFIDSVWEAEYDEHKFREISPDTLCR